VYDPEGYALTNYHVVKAAGKTGFAGLADGRLYPWKLIGLDPGGDVAIIKLSGRKEFPFAPLGNSDAVKVGDFAMAMGNPFLLAEDQRPTVTLGLVSGVKRFQPGQGNNLLVYGNCIQVDSSINPGNSGGPLFNMSGEIIGINGRGSFMERGRVNVGVGYAISSEQIKNFIPELLATKVAQHGTLNAVFGNRRDGVICYQLNLDSPIASAGMDVGDRLISFEGHEIANANELTNLMSTLPDNWPVEVVFERGGERRTAWVRLTDLPYGPVQKQPDLPLPRKRDDDKKKPEDGKPGDSKPGDSKPGDSKPGDGPKPVRPAPVAAPQQKPGEITDRKWNQLEAARVTAAWHRFAGGTDAIRAAGAFRFADDIVRQGQPVGRHELLVTGEGRFRVEYTLDGASHLFGFDGEQFWAGPGEETPGPMDADDALDDPMIVAAHALGTAFADKGLARFAGHELTGSDKADRQRAFRLRGWDKAKNDLNVWMSQYDAAGRPETRLLKASSGSDGSPADTAVLFSQYRPTAGVMLPRRRTIVAGLSERVELELVNIGCEAVRSPSESSFRSPQDAEKK
jgi:S1-C subfamily serine protease